MRFIKVFSGNKLRPRRITVQYGSQNIHFAFRIGHETSRAQPGLSYMQSNPSLLAKATPNKYIKRKKERNKNKTAALPLIKLILPTRNSLDLLLDDV